MDIVCPRCGEPMDVYELSAAVEAGEFSDYTEARKTFFSEGCGVFWGSHPCTKVSGDLRADASALLHEILGDDVDGIASELDMLDQTLGSDFS